MPRDLPHERRGPSRSRQGDGTGPGQPGGTGLGVLRRALSGDLSGALPAPRRNPGAVRGKGLVDGRRLPDPQSDAPQSRVSRQGGHRGLRRGADSPGPRGAQGRRHSGRRPGPLDRLAGRQPLRGREGDPGGLPHRNALCGAPGSAVACVVPPELRMLASGGGARPCRARRLLRALRRPPDFRRGGRGRPRHPAAEVRRHVLLLRLRGHGDRERVLRRRRRRRPVGRGRPLSRRGRGGDGRRGEPALRTRRRRGSFGYRAQGCARCSPTGKRSLPSTAATA